MWELNNKKGWVRRIGAFKLLSNCLWTIELERLLRVPWTARRLNQSILKEINPEYSLEVLMLKLKLQYFGHPMWRADSLEKTLMLRNIEGRIKEHQRKRWLDGITDWNGINFSKLQKMVRNREACHVTVHQVANSWKQISD